MLSFQYSAGSEPKTVAVAGTEAIRVAAGRSSPRPCRRRSSRRPTGSGRAAGGACRPPGVGRGHDLVRVVRIDHDLDLAVEVVRRRRVGGGDVAVRPYASRVRARSELFASGIHCPVRENCVDRLVAVELAGGLFVEFDPAHVRTLQKARNRHFVMVELHVDAQILERRERHGDKELIEGGLVSHASLESGVERQNAGAVPGVVVAAAELLLAGTVFGGGAWYRSAERGDKREAKHSHGSFESRGHRTTPDTQNAQPDHPAGEPGEAENWTEDSSCRWKVQHGVSATSGE